MKKYILLSTVETDMNIEGIYDFIESARKRMAEIFCEVVDEDKTYDELLEDEEYENDGYDCCFSTDNCYAETLNHDDFAAEIFAVNIPSNVDDIVESLLGQLIMENETASFKLKDERTIDLVKVDDYFEVALICNDEEFKRQDFHLTCGIIEKYNFDDISSLKEYIEDLIIIDRKEIFESDLQRELGESITLKVINADNEVDYLIMQKSDHPPVEEGNDVVNYTYIGRKDGNRYSDGGEVDVFDFDDKKELFSTIFEEFNILEFIFLNKRDFEEWKKLSEIIKENNLGIGE